MQYTRRACTFDVLEYGNKTDEPIVLLHGFPSEAASWKPVAERLAAAGCYVLVPEQRGYSEGARPGRRRDYTLDELVADVAALLDHTHKESAHIVGHDWGGVVAWAFGAAHPQRTKSLTVVSTPHPKAFLRSLIGSRQLARAWYMIFFQLPWLPEHILTGNNGKRLKNLLVGFGLNPRIASVYATNMQDRERLRGALNWYRAMPFTLLTVRRINRVQARSLFIYGAEDAFLSDKAAQLTKEWATESYRLPHASHWIPEESPEQLANAILKFI